MDFSLYYTKYPFGELMPTSETWSLSSSLECVVAQAKLAPHNVTQMPGVVPVQRRLGRKF